MAFGFKRNDELATFILIRTRETVVWAAGRNEGCIWHATVNGLHAVCSRAIIVDIDWNPYPSTVDRSNDLMTCDRCAGLVARVKP